MVDYLEHIKFHICALESAPRGVLADFLKARPDVACEIFRGMSGPYSVMIKGEKETGEVVMALHDSEILAQAGLYLADFAEHHDNIVVSGTNAADFGNRMQRLVNADEKKCVQGYYVDDEAASRQGRPGDYRLAIEVIFEQDVAG